MWILLGDEAGPVAWFLMADSLRSEAGEVIERLQAEGIEVQLLSGDPSAIVEEVAETFGVEVAIRGATPQEKVRHVHSLQRAGAVVAMVGDGVNDVPVLGSAGVSFAMGGGTDLAKTNADAVLLGDDLSNFMTGLVWAKKTRKIIWQNLSWALVYNLTVLPLAALGYVAPYVAALGMSASSLLVVSNALRLNTVRTRRRKR